jgi:hypothetical protein
MIDGIFRSFGSSFGKKAGARGARLIGGKDLVADRIAEHIKIPAAAVEVPPTLGVDSFGIVPHIEVIRPCLIIQAAWGFHPDNMGLSAVMELGFGAITAKWARY